MLDGVQVHSGFSIGTPRGAVYWEHLRMFGNYQYCKSWERKERLYERCGITRENGKLILSHDELNGAIDTKEIQALIMSKL